MKFNDGFWLLKHGVRAYYGTQVTNTTVQGESLQLQVSTKPIRHRGDTLGGPLLSVKIHSPAEGIIGVKLEHLREHNPNPATQLFPNEEPLSFTPKITKVDGESSFTTGALTAAIINKPYSIKFQTSNGLLTEAGPKHQAIYDVPYKWTINSAPNSSCLACDPNSNPNGHVHPETVQYINSELTISPGELFYGLGEQFGPFVKNGQSIAIWNQDGGTSSEQAYKCVPFYISNRGYGVFVNHFGNVEFELGSEKVSRVGASIAGQSLEFYIIHGATPLDILSNYTLLTGRPALPPSWSFGLWLSTSFLTDYSSKTVSGFLSEMQERNCPVKVFHFDCFWMKQYEWCSFTFDPDNFPDPKSYLSEIKAKFGVKVCVWINPYFSQHSPIFEEGATAGYFIKRRDSSVWQWDLWQPGLAILDVTNPKALEWYSGKLSHLLDLGVDAFKTDFAERIPHNDVVYHDGSDPYRMHNAYAILYNEVVFNLLERRFGKGEAVLFARASAAGGQRFPVHWGGDCESTFEAMAETIRGVLSLTQSGFAFASHDIGGFEGSPPAEIYIRWLAFGLFSSHSRLHGSASYRVPWVYGEEAPKILAKLLGMKQKLMPYIYSNAIKANVVGHPVQRAMWLDFPSDRTTHHLDLQYMFGPSLLVAPVFVPQEVPLEYYLPEGTWTSLWDFTVQKQGPSWVKELVDLDHIPVWIRPGSVITFGPLGTRRPDYELSKGVEVGIFELGSGHNTEVQVTSGKLKESGGRIGAKREGSKLYIDLTWNGMEIASIFFVYSSVTTLKAVSGATISQKQQKAIVPNRGATQIVVDLE